MSQPNRAKLCPTGERLLALARRRGYNNLRAASVAAGIHYPVLYDIASGSRDPRLSTLERLVAELGGTMSEFYAELEPGK